MPEPDRIRVLVVDDHTLFRRGLIALLSLEPGLQIVGDAADAGEALRRVSELHPDVVLLDNHLPGATGRPEARATSSLMAGRLSVATPHSMP